MSGIKPQIKLGEVRTSCVVRSNDACESFESCREYDVTLELVFWEEYGHMLDVTEPVELFDGSRLIARGRFLDGAYNPDPPEVQAEAS